MARSARVAIHHTDDPALQERGGLSKDYHVGVTFLFGNRKIKYSIKKC